MVRPKKAANTYGSGSLAESPLTPSAGTFTLSSSFTSSNPSVISSHSISSLLEFYALNDRAWYITHHLPRAELRASPDLWRNGGDGKDRYATNVVISVMEEILRRTCSILASDSLEPSEASAALFQCFVDKNYVPSDDEQAQKQLTTVAECYMKAKKGSIEKKTLRATLTTRSRRDIQKLQFEFPYTMSLNAFSTGRTDLELLRSSLSLEKTKRTLEPLYFREKTVDHYGKRGISWHESLVRYFKYDDGSSSGETGHPTAVDTKLYYDRFSVSDMKQDREAVVSLIEAVLIRLKRDLPHITRITFLSDNATCYQNWLIPLILPYLSHVHGIDVVRIIHTETQDGKSILDAHFARAMEHIVEWVKEGNNCLTPTQAVIGLQSNGGILNCVAELIEHDRSRLKELANEVAGMEQCLRRIVTRANEVVIAWHTGDASELPYWIQKLSIIYFDSLRIFWYDRSGLYVWTATGVKIFTQGQLRRRTRKWKVKSADETPMTTTICSKDAVSYAVKVAMEMRGAGRLFVQDARGNYDYHAISNTDSFQIPYSFPPGWAQRHEWGNMYGAKYIGQFKNEIEAFFKEGLANSSAKTGPGRMLEKLKAAHTDIFVFLGRTRSGRKLVS
ncbi:unnamed protein product [Phytophthora lilii]|uniref:Unnamed protein product n=1 Tax=Phytophthora lilii TaxID=2077276 RepID=A0A9W6U4Y8_9STRA|nr:unnamed protein product [Phytophthora lilii]